MNNILRTLVLVLALFGVSPAFAACTGQFLGGTLCGNNTALQGIPGPTANPVLGVPGINTGTLGFAGSSSGTVTISAQAGAGAATLLLPTTSGTFASSGSAPIVLNAVTGVLTCPTCVVGAGGALINGTTPTSGYSAGQLIISNGSVISAVTPAAGQVLAGATPAFTATPTLGASGTVGTITFGNGTSGTVTLGTVTGALGSVTASLPANTGTIAELNLAQTFTAAQVINSTSSQAFTVGANGSSNPAFQVDASTASSVTGIAVKSASTGGGVALTALDTGASTALSLNAKGAGIVLIGSVSTGGVSLGGPTTVSGTGGSLSVSGADANFGAGGNRALMDFAAGFGRIGSTSGGGSAVGLQIISNGVLALTFDTSSNASFSKQVIINSTSGNALAVGPSGSTNATLLVDSSTASSVTGIAVKSAASGGGIALSAISTNTNEGITINAKGNGTITFNNLTTGVVNIPNQLSLGSGGSLNGLLSFVGATSGNIFVTVPSGALGSVTNTLQAATDTFVYRATPDTLTNKTITSSTDSLGGVTMTLGSDATGDIYYRNSGGVLTRLPIGGSANVLTVSGGLPFWASPGSGGTVTSITPGGGLVSSTTASCSQTAITVSGTLSGSECVDSRTTTSEAINDSDRGKLVTASNTAAQAYTIAQAGAASNFQAGWTTEIRNVQPTSQPAAIVTLTPTTSTICGLASIKVYPGQTLKIVSDGTNYQCPNQQGSRGDWVLLNTLTASNSTVLADTTSITAQFTEYEIVLEQILPATNSVGIQFQLQVGGTFQTTNYISSDINGNGSITSSNALTTAILAANGSSVTNSAPGLNARYLLSNPAQTLTCKHMFGEFVFNSGTAVVPGVGGGCYNGGSGAITGIQTMSSSGNLTSGVMKIYGRL